MTELLVGGIGIMLAALLGGATGFGFGLVATPSLLAAGIPLHQVVAANLALALLTRLIPAWQLRRHLVWPRAGRLIAGAVPGILAGFAIRDAIDTDALKVFTGVLAIAAALALTFRRPRTTPATDPNDEAPRTTTPPSDEADPERDVAPDPLGEPRPATDGPARTTRARGGGGAEGDEPARPGGTQVVVAGVGGGFLGVTTSLNGVPPALLLTRDRVAQLPFIADMTVYFVVGNVITLGVLAAGDPGTVTSVWHYVLAWLPLGVLGNQIGVRSAKLLPYRAFRAIALTVVFLSGCVTVAGAL